jgi:hypothetical protein
MLESILKGRYERRAVASVFIVVNDPDPRLPSEKLSRMISGAVIDYYNVWPIAANLAKNFFQVPLFVINRDGDQSRRGHGVSCEEIVYAFFL